MARDVPQPVEMDGMAMPAIRCRFKNFGRPVRERQRAATLRTRQSCGPTLSHTTFMSILRQLNGRVHWRSVPCEA